MKIKAHEDHVTEFKTSWDDDYLKWICAFANTEGGNLYIGVEDNGEICGVKNVHRLSEDIPSKIRSTMGLICPVTLLKTDDGKDYLRIEVEKYDYPVSFRGKYYKRSGSTMQEVSGIELDRMLLSEQRRTWDSIPVSNVSVDDLSSDALEVFRKYARDTGRLDEASVNITNEALLRNLHLFEGDRLTRAAVLAFHPDPEQWITGANIKISYFKNDADISYMDVINGPLIMQVDKAIDTIYIKYMKAFVSFDGIHRKEVNFFPKEAFRELLLNALVHRDYFSTQPVTIRITDSEIRIWNPGQLPKEVTPENIYKEHLSIPCNPLLANIFFKCGMIEAWGRGFQKILYFCNLDKKNPPVIDPSLLGGVCIRCYASDSCDNPENQTGSEQSQPKDKEAPITSEKKETLDEEIIGLIKENPTITFDELTQKTGKSRSTIKRCVQKLQSDGSIKREGGKKLGQWIICSEKIHTLNF